MAFHNASADQVVRQLPLARAPQVGKIKHIIVVIQENRTFNNLFGGPNGFPGALTTSTAVNSHGKTVALKPRGLAAPGDLDNYYPAYLEACNAPSSTPFVVGEPSPCRMTGFDRPQRWNHQEALAYADYGDTGPYWDIAKKYALGDHFFQGHNSESYTAHQFLFASQSAWVNQAPSEPFWQTPFDPWGCDTGGNSRTKMIDPKTWNWPSNYNGPRACFGYPSLADRLNSKGLTWRLYLYSFWMNINGFDAIKSIRDSSEFHEGNTFRTPQGKFLTDLKNPNYTLASVTWLLPGPLSSDHPGVPFGYYGPSWVADVVNAVGHSRYWKDTAIFVTWDDWGGFYDPVPPYVVRDAQGPGFRVPLIVVSPYAKRGRVVKSDAEFGTLVKFIEQTFGLANLGGTDTSPDLGSLNGYFDWNIKRSFVPVLTKTPPTFFERNGEKPIFERLKAEHELTTSFFDGD